MAAPPKGFNEDLIKISMAGVADVDGDDRDFDVLMLFWATRELLLKDSVEAKDLDDANHCSWIACSCSCSVPYGQ